MQVFISHKKQNNDSKHVPIRWMAKSFYVYGCGGEGLPEGLTANGASCCTISFKKRGGVEKAWELAKQCAKWT